MCAIETLFLPEFRRCHPGEIPGKKQQWREVGAACQRERGLQSCILPTFTRQYTHWMDLIRNRNVRLYQEQESAKRGESGVYAVALLTSCCHLESLRAASHNHLSLADSGSPGPHTPPSHRISEQQRRGRWRVIPCTPFSTATRRKGGQRIIEWIYSVFVQTLNWRTNDIKINAGKGQWSINK